MARLSRGETLATGMVRPKATALFFDKLWVHPALIRGFAPSDGLEIHRVPAEVCVTKPLAAKDYYDSFLTQGAYVASGRARLGRMYPDLAEALRRLNAETWDLTTIFQIEAWEHFERMDSPLWTRLQEQFGLERPQYREDELYVSTHQRNKAIGFIVQVYAARGIPLTPIYLTRPNTMN